MLLEHKIQLEDFGGDVQSVCISALKVCDSVIVQCSAAFVLSSASFCCTVVMRSCTFFSVQQNI